MSVPQGDGDFGESFQGMRYGSYEDPKSFEPYQLILLGLDLIFNWLMDWAHTDPLAILVIFVFQCLGLIVSFIVYIMASASQAMQSGLRKSLVYHHQVNIVTWIAYIILTCSWYIWALRKSWPSVSDQFSFSFSSGSSSPEEQSDIMTSSTNLTGASNTTTTVSPLITSLVTQSLNNSKRMRRLFLGQEGGMEDIVQRDDKPAKELYTLWSSGFLALYVVQRTVAIIHYSVCLKATYLVLNASTIDKLNGSKYPNPDGDNSRSRGTTASNGYRSKRPGRIEMDEGDSETSELADERDWKNFRNSFEISRDRKSRRDSRSYLSQGVTLSPKITGRGGNYYENSRSARH